MLFIVKIIMNNVDGVMLSFLFRMFRFVEMRVKGIMSLNMRRVFCEKGLKMGKRWLMFLRLNEDMEVILFVLKNVDCRSMKKKSVIWVFESCRVLKLELFVVLDLEDVGLVVFVWFVVNFWMLYFRCIYVSSKL